MSQTIGEALLGYQNTKKISKNAVIREELEEIRHFADKKVEQETREMIEKYRPLEPSEKRQDEKPVEVPYEQMEEAHDLTAKYCLDSEPCDKRIRKEPIFQAVREAVA